MKSSLSKFFRYGSSYKEHIFRYSKKELLLCKLSLKIRLVIDKTKDDLFFKKKINMYIN